MGRDEHRHTMDRDVWHMSLGAATLVLVSSERRRSEIVTIGAFLLPFAKLNQLSVINGRNSAPKAYVTWGNLTPEGLSRLAAQPEHLPDIDDLNAGDILVIFDIVSGLRSFAPVREFIQGLLGGNRNTLYGLRFDKRLHKLVLRRYFRKRRE